VTLEILEKLTDEFLKILDKCPSRLRRKMLSGSGQGPAREPSLKSSSTSNVRSQSHFFYCSFNVCIIQLILCLICLNVQQDDKKPVDSKHGSSASSGSKFPDPTNPQPSASGASTSAANSASAAASKESSLYSKPVRKDVPNNSYTATVTSSSSAPTTNNSHSSHYEKKDSHTGYSLYKDKKDMDRKSSSGPQAPPSHAMSHGKSTSSSSTHSNDSKPVNHPYHLASATHAQQHMPSDAHNKPTTASNASKQQQIASEKQRLMEERSKIRNKPNEDLWNDTKTSHTAGSSVAALLNNGSHSKSQTSSEYANHAFYENLLNDNAGSMYGNSNSNSSGDSKHFKTDSLQSNDNEDSCDLMKRDSHNDLKMEFSDNESNQSPAMNLTSISSLMMPEQSNGYLDNVSSRDLGSPMKNTKPKNSFMSIFTEDESMKPSHHPNSQLAPKKETSFELKNHLVDYSSLNSVLDYQLQPTTKMLSPLAKEETIVSKKMTSKSKSSHTLDGSLKQSQSNKLTSHSSNMPIPSKLTQPQLSHFTSQAHGSAPTPVMSSKVKNEPKTPPKSSKSPVAAIIAASNMDGTHTHAKLMAPSSNSLHSSASVGSQFAHHQSAYLSSSHSNLLPVSQNSSLSGPIANPLSNSKPLLSNMKPGLSGPLSSQPPSLPLSSHSSSAVSSVLLDQTSLSGQLPLLNQLPPPVALELPPLPSAFPIKVQPDPTAYGSSMMLSTSQPVNSGALQSLYSQSAHDSAAIVDQQQFVAPTVTPALSMSSRPTHHDLGALLDTHKHSSKSKDKDKDRGHEKHHKHHKEKKHKHKSKDKHKDKHKDKELKMTLAVEKTGTDDMMNNNKPIRLKIMKKPATEEPSVASIGGDNSDQKKGLKIIIPKASLSTSSDRKRRNSPKEARSSSKMAKLDDSL
jgi:hypothetical protein